jgi:uncharacterized protein YhbP (UPF0306 family)
MYKLEAKDHETSQLTDSIEDILAQTKLLSMATVRDSEPWINTASFAYDDDLKLYIITYPKATHSQNILINNKVAVTIFNSQQEGKLKQGLQLVGTCKQLIGNDAHHGTELWGKRIIGEAGFDKFMTDFQNWTVKLYEITIDWVKIFDEQRNGREVWVEAKVSR